MRRIGRASPPPFSQVGGKAKSGARGEGKRRARPALLLPSRGFLFRSPPSRPPQSRDPTRTGIRWRLVTSRFVAASPADAVRVPLAMRTTRWGAFRCRVPWPQTLHPNDSAAARSGARATLNDTRKYAHLHALAARRARRAYSRLRRRGTIKKRRRDPDRHCPSPSPLTCAGPGPALEPAPAHPAVLGTRCHAVICFRRSPLRPVLLC